MTTNITSLPNPFTPLAFLPPVRAGQVQATAYIYVGVLSALSWDWLMSIREEIHMCRNRKLGPAIGLYFISRISTLAYCTLAAIFYVVPLAHCHATTLALGSILMLVIPSTSALFFFRVRAVYYNNKIITIVFGLLWLSLVGLSFLIPQATSATHIGTTQMCIITRIAPYVSIPVLMHATFDSLVFLAISFRIISFSIVGDTFSARAKSFFRGDGLPSLPRSLLIGGQVYYVVASAFNILLAVLLLAPMSRAYATMFLIPHVAVCSTMACRVFRGIRLGYLSDTDPVAPKASSLRFAKKTTTTTGSSTKCEDRVEDSKHTSNHIVIEITKETEAGEPIGGEPYYLNWEVDKPDSADVRFQGVGD